MDSLVQDAVRLAMAREAQFAAVDGEADGEDSSKTVLSGQGCGKASAKKREKKALSKNGVLKKKRGEPVLSGNHMMKSAPASSGKGKPEQQDAGTAAPLSSPPSKRTRAKVSADSAKNSDKTTQEKQSAAPTEKAAAKRKPSQVVSRKKALSSNWDALRKAMPKSGLVKKHRTRLRPKAAPIVAKAPEDDRPLAGSVFFKGVLRANSVKTTRVVALDCEFVGVGPEGKTDALARASLVNSRGEILFDAFVRVEEPIVDFRTRWSGVRPDHLASKDAVDPREARAAIAEVLRGRILVGHAVQSDLKVLRIQHPRRDTRDTSLFYKKLWRREGRRGGAPPALRLVVARVLGVDQFQRREHDSCEDARAALALYKKNAKDWESNKGR